MDKNIKKLIGRGMLTGLLSAVILCVTPHDVKADSTYEKTVSVEEYGADGTDTKGDSAAIQKALNEANSISGTLLVTVPAGTYYLDTGLVIYDGTELRLEDGAKFVRASFGESLISNGHLGSDGKYCDVNTGNCKHGGYQQGNNITITGGIWDGNAKGNESKELCGMMFYLRHAENINISNTTLTNCTDLHMIVMDAVQNATIDHVTFSNALFYTGKDAESLEEYYGTSSINTSSLTTAQKYDAGSDKEAVHIDFASAIVGNTLPADNTGCKNISVTNCTFTDVFAGVGAHHDEVDEGMMHSRLTVTGCTFTNLFGNAVDAFRINGLTMTDNIIDGANYVLNTNTAYNINVSKNTIGQSYEYQIWLCNVSGSVKENIFTSTLKTNTAIRGRYSTKELVISGNTIVGGECGIHFSDCSNIEIAYNKIENAAEKAIGIVDCKNIVVDHNYAVNSGSEYDIAMWGCTGSSCTSNTVTSNPRDDICYNNDTICSGNTQVSLTGWAQNDKGQWCLYKNDEIVTSYNDVVYIEKQWRCVKNGVEATSYTGLAKNSNGWWYIKNGKIDFTYSGLAKHAGSWWRIAGGKLDFSYNGFCKWNGTWWCIVNGKYDSSKSNTLYKHSNGTWFYMKSKGVVDFSYTGLVKYNNAWWYVKGGTLDFGFTGLGKNKSNGTWWYVKNGKVDFSCNTFVQYNGQWWNIQGGGVDFAYCGLKRFGNSWWYVKGGLIDKSVSAPVRHNGTWYAVVNGKVNFTYNGYLSNKNGKYLFKNGKICF